MDCIRLNGYEKKKLSKNNARLRGLAPDFIGGEAVFQVDVLKVVEVNGSGIIQRHIKVIRIAAEQRHGRGPIQLLALVRQALDVFGGPQRASTGSDGMHDYPDEGSGGRNRGVEGSRLHGVGGGDEQDSQPGGRNRSARDDL